MKHTFLIIAILLMMSDNAETNNSSATNKIATVSPAQEQIYVLTSAEKTRWGIKDNGTNPIETTKGFNDALKWASEQGYTTFRVEAGTYLIAKGTKEQDPEARINMVGNMTFSSHENAIFKKETNGWETYSLLFIGEVSNVVIQGGQFIGDRDTHDYSKKGPGLSGTHEWGNGINTKGASNVVIDGLTMKNFSGDSIEIGAGTIAGYNIEGQDLETGSFDSNGQPVPSSGKVRSKNKQLTNLKQDRFQGYELFMWLPAGVTSNLYGMFYYKEDGSFIKSEKGLKFFSSQPAVPSDAAYYHAVFDSPQITGVKVNAMYVIRSRDITIKNSDLGFSRRQGISVVGGENINITNNTIHDVNGTAPQSGIDLEGGFYLNHNVTIKQNHFFNNKGYDVILFDGNNALVQGNKLESNAIGLAVSKPFYNATIKNNVFNNASINVVGNDVKIIHNTVVGASVRLTGDGIELYNTSVTNGGISVDSTTPLSIELKNVTVNNENVYVGRQPVRFENVTIKGSGASISGQGSNESIYENLTISDYNRMSLPRGKYIKCSFNSDIPNALVLINMEGRFILENCKMKTVNNLLLVSNKADLTIDNSYFEIIENVGYGAALYVLGAKDFILSNSEVIAKNNIITHTPVIKLGPYGSPKPTDIFAATIKNVNIYGKKGLPKLAIGLDTKNAGTDAPPYLLSKVELFDLGLNLKSNDQIIN